MAEPHFHVGALRVANQADFQATDFDTGLVEASKRLRIR